MAGKSMRLKLAFIMAAVLNAWKTVLGGTLPLTLTNSIAAALRRLVRYGKVTQPPVDYLSTVTQAGAIEQRNLPQGYTEREYIDNNGEAWLDLGMPIGSSDVVTFDMAWNDALDVPFFGAYNAGGNYGFNSFVGTFNSDRSLVCFYANSYTIIGRFSKPVNTRFTLKWNGINAMPTLNGEAIGTNVPPYSDFTPSVNAYLFTRNQGGTAGSVDDITLYGFKVERNGAVIMNLIPATRDSDNAVGMYDKVSGSFIGNAGTGSFTAGPIATPTPDRPMDLWTNNGVLKARHQSGLPLGHTLLSYIQSSGYQVIDTGYLLRDTDRVEMDYTLIAADHSGDKFLLGARNPSGNSYGGVWISAYTNSDGNPAAWYVRFGTSTSSAVATFSWEQQQGTLSLGKGQFMVNGTVVATPNYVSMPIYPLTLFNRYASDGVLEAGKGAYMQMSEARIFDGDNNLIHRYVADRRDSDNEVGVYDLVDGVFIGNTGTGAFTAGTPVSDPVEVYPDGTPSTVTDADGNTATLETLLACGSYADTEEVIAGVKTGKIGAKVLDGTENWRIAGEAGNYRYYLNDATFFADWERYHISGSSPALVCTHFTFNGYSANGASIQDDGFNAYLPVAPQDAYIRLKPKSISIETIAAFKAFLAAQFAAGTPVIVLYPLATPTTESVPGQVLVNAPLTVSAEVTMPAPTTTEAAVSTPDPKHPLPLWCNNGELEYGQYGNLIDLDAVTDGYYYTPSGTYSQVTDCRLTDYIPVKAGEKYTVWAQAEALQSNANVRANLFDSSRTWLSQSSVVLDSLERPKVLVVTPTEDGYLRVSANYQSANRVNLSTLQIVQGEYTVSTMPPYEPYHFGLHTDTPEVLTVSNNWFDRSEDYAVNNGKYLNSSGAWTGSAGTAFLTLIAKLDEGKEYTVQRTTTDIGNCALRITAFDSSTPSNTSGHYSVIYLGTSSDTSYTFTVPTGFPYVAVYVRHSSGTATDEAVISAFKVYQGSYAEQTASVPMLLAVGDYRDEAELIAGIKTGKVGAWGLTGQEAWELNSVYGTTDNAFLSRNAVPFKTNSRVLACTHFVNKSNIETAGYVTVGVYAGSQISFFCGNGSEINSIEKWKAFLAAQFAAGNPVIVIYPLATSTTEQTTPQALNSYNGVTLIDTECAVLPVDGEAEYKYGTTPTPPPVPDTDCIEFSSSAPFTLATANSTKNWDGTLYTSPDAIHWSEWDGREAASSSNDGKLYVRGSGNTVICGNEDGKGWVLTGRSISCSGDIRYLLDHDEPERPTMANGCFYGLFRGNTALTSAPELPATTLSANCYRDMFYGCTALTTPPELPARTLAASCYREMFYNCTALTSAPELPATTMVAVCYYRMFYNCSSLTTAPALPATTLAANCYSYMFISCTALTTPPALPATTLTDNCYYYMFYDCTSLTALPELPADRLVSNCYGHMFHGCSAIKVSDREVGDYAVKYQTIPPVDTGSVEEQTDAAEMFKGTGGYFTGTPYSSTKYFLDKNNSVIPATRARLAILAGSPQPDMSEEDAQTAVDVITGGNR